MFRQYCGSFLYKAHNSIFAREGTAYFSAVIKCKKAWCYKVLAPILCTVECLDLWQPFHIGIFGKWHNVYELIYQDLWIFHIWLRIKNACLISNICLNSVILGRKAKWLSTSSLCKNDMHVNSCWYFEGSKAAE